LFVPLLHLFSHTCTCAVIFLISALCCSFLCFFFFFCNATATTEIYTLSLHDALPIYEAGLEGIVLFIVLAVMIRFGALKRPGLRSEEHTSELQSHLNLVCRLLLEKKNRQRTKQQTKSFHKIVTNSHRVRKDMNPASSM